MTEDDPGDAGTRPDLDATLDTYLATWQLGDADRLADLADVLAPDMRFRDPFHNVHGVEAVIAALKSAYDRVDHVHITIRARARDGDVSLVLWTFQFRTRKRGTPMLLEGVAEIHQDPETGLITEHLDHWDAAEQFFQDLPVVGFLIRMIKKRL